MDNHHRSSRCIETRSPAAKPKSANSAWNPGSPDPKTRTLPGLMSRWTKPMLWRCWAPSAKPKTSLDWCGRKGRDLHKNARSTPYPKSAAPGVCALLPPTLPYTQTLRSLENVVALVRWVLTRRCNATPPVRQHQWQLGKSPFLGNKHSLPKQKPTELSTLHGVCIVSNLELSRPTSDISANTGSWRPCRGGQKTSA